MAAPLCTRPGRVLDTSAAIKHILMSTQVGGVSPVSLLSQLSFGSAVSMMLTIAEREGGGAASTVCYHPQNCPIVLPGRQRMLIVALTGWNDALTNQRVIDVGFDAHLTKPAMLETLTSIIEKAPFLS